MKKTNKLISMLTAAALLLGCMLITAVPVSAAETTMSFGTKSNIKGISQIRWGNMGFGEYDLNVHKDNWPTINTYNNIGDATYENLSMQNLSSVPWFSLTLNAENAGEYEIKIRFKYYDGSKDPVFNKQDQITKAAAFINGERHDFDVVHSSDGKYYMSGSCSLNKGSNGLVVTAMLDCDNETEQPVQLFNDVTLPAGVSLSDQVYNPLDNTLRLEAETYGNDCTDKKILKVDHYDNPNVSPGNSGNNVLVIPFDAFGSSRVMQTEEEIMGAVDENNTIVANFYVDAQNEGDYTFGLRAVYMSYFLDDAYQEVKPTIYRIVNDGAPEKLELRTLGKDESVSFEVHLKKGRNLLRLTSFSKEYFDYAAQYGTNTANVNTSTHTIKNYTFRFDYIDVPVGITGVLPPTEVKFAANASTDRKHGTKSPDYDDIFDLDFTDVGDINADTVSSSNLSNVPYFSVTVNAPTDGYYALAGEFRYFSTEANKMAVLIDGENSNIRPKFIASSKGADSVGTHKSDYVTYLTAGEHVITFTGLMESIKTETSANQPVTIFYRVYLRGGLTVAETQHTHKAVRIETASVTEGINAELPSGLVEPGAQLTVPVTAAENGLTPVLGLEFGSGEGYSYQRAKYNNDNFVFNMPQEIPAGEVRATLVYLNDLNGDAKADILDMVRVAKAVDKPAGLDFAAFLAADSDYSDALDKEDVQAERNLLLGK